MGQKYSFLNHHIELLFQGKFSPYDTAKGFELFKRKEALTVKEHTSLEGGLLFQITDNEALYRVEMINYFDNHLSLSCTCEHGTYGHCSHGFSALLMLDQEILNPSAKAQKYTAYSKDRENRTLWPLEWVKRDELLKQAVTQGFYEMDLSHYYFKYLNVTESEIIGEVIPGYLRNYEKKRIVKVSALGQNASTLCNCGHQFGKLCKHQTIALLKLAQEPLFPAVVVKEERDALIESELEKYGLIGKVLPEDFASFKLDDFNQLILHKESEFVGVIPVESESADFSLLLNDIDSDNESIIASDFSNTDEDDSEDYAIGYALEFGSKPHLISLIPLIGKLNRARTSLQTNIRRYDYGEYLPVQEGVTDDALQIVTRKLSIDRVFQYLDSKGLNFENDSQLVLNAARYQYPYLVELFSLISSCEYSYVCENGGDLGTFSYTKANLHAKEFVNKRASFFLRVSEDQNFISLLPRLEIDGLEYALDDPGVKVWNHMVVEVKKCLYLIENLHQAFGLYRFTKGENYKMSLEYRDKFLEKCVCPLSYTFKIVFDEVESFDVEEVKLSYVKSKLYVASTDNYVTFRPVVEYEGGYEVNIFKTGNPISLFSNFVNIHHRNWEQEHIFKDLLISLNTLFSKQFPESFLYMNNTEMMRDFWFHSAFEQLSAAGVEVYGINDLKKLKYSPYQASIRTQVASGIDWFEVKVEVAYGDNVVSLAEVKKAILKKDRFIKLSDGTIGVIPEEWIGRFEKFFKVGETENDQILISKRMFSAAEMLFDGIDYEAIKHELNEKQRRIRSFSEIQKVQIPDGINATLMNYQYEGVNWLNFLDEFKWGGILADDMGLGKTLQTIVFLKMVSQKSALPNLVVVPTSLIYNWESELNKFCPSLSKMFYYGLDRDFNEEEFNKNNIIVTTYGILLNEEERFKSLQFNYVILDESQNIKNLSSKRYKSVSKLKSQNRLAITGTPIENSTFDLYAQMNFVNPGFLGTPAFFRDYFSNNIDKEKNERIAAELQKIISPFVLRRTKEQVALDLPPKSEEIIYYQMGTEQRRVYDAFRNKFREEIHQHIAKEGVEKAKMHVLKGLICLRQICDSPALLNKIEDYGDDSVKIRELMRIIAHKSGNHKILIFSQFVTMLHLIRKEIQELGIGFEYLDGSSTPKQRDASVVNFQENESCRIFLVSLKAGGTGLNLTAADYVYLVDPWWNPAVETQAIDRTHRIGQNKPVFAYRLICKDSVEERIINYQKRKQKVASDVIYTGQSFVKELTKSDIEDIFK